MRLPSLARLLVPLLLAASGTALGGEEAHPPGGVVKENRLAGARSPYLRQHRTNPVDWYPWAEEARERARSEDRPIFLSVGYAACHWCHVMEHESFEDEETAALLNRTFVCVKVDREERPDVDALYMRAVQVMTGRGGWPMTVILTPEGAPFFAATYLPRERLRELAAKVGQAWSQHADDIRRQAALVTERIAELGDGQDLPPFEGSDADLLHLLETSLAAHYDRVRGGYGAAPKFPPHAELLYLLDRAERDGETEGLEQVRGTLDAMAAGGVHDQVGGGFHRYSTDGVWLLPHFEKMLYDNALLAQAYARAAALTGDAGYARVARGILDWVERDMARPGGGYASSLDADTEGEEGLTYTWTVDELRGLLPAADADLAVRVFGASPEGNFHDEATGRLSGRNVLHVAADAGGDASRLDGIRQRLLAARSARPQPGLDEKVITAWNGLLLSAFAVGGRALGDETLLERGRALAAFLLRACRREDGTLLRFPRDDGEEIVGFCEDHVHLADGLLDLAEATGEASWAEAAAALADALLADFEDPDAGGFFATSGRHHERLVVGRQKETFDSPIPSDNATAARVLLRLAARTGEARYREAAQRTLAAWRPLLGWARAARGTVALYRALALRLATAPPEARTGDVSVDVDPVRVDAFLERREAAPGRRVRLALRVALADGWHVNADRPSDPDLVASALQAADGAPARLADVRWPEPVSRPLVDGGDAVALFEGTFWVRAVLEVPAGAPPGPRRIPLVLTLQPCDAASCLAPREIRLALALRFGEDGAALHPGVFPE